MIKLDNFLNINLLPFIVLNLGNLSSYIFQFLLSRYVSVDTFGQFNSLNSVMNLLLIPSSFIGFFVIKFYSQINIDNEKFKKLVISYSFLITFLMFVLVYLLYFLFPFIFKINNIQFLYLNIYISIIFFVSFIYGYLQSKKKYILFSFSSSLILYVKVILLLIFYYYFQINLTYLLLILVLSSLSPLIINYKIIFKNIFPFYFKIDRSFLKIFNKYIFLLFSVLTFKSFFLSSDIYLVSLYNDNNITGLYTSASILSKIVFYIPSVLINILFTESILSKLNAKSDQNKLFIFLFFNTLLTIFLLFIFYYFGEIFLSLSFGNQFVVAKYYLFKLCIAMSFFSFITYFLYYMMGKNDYHVILPIIFSILIYIAIIPFYNSPYQIINLQIIVLFITFAYLFIRQFFWIKS